MKSTKMITLLAASTLALTLALPLTSSAEEKEVKSNGAVQFVPNTDPTLPLDPTNPDPEKPVTPKDPTTPDGKPNPGTVGPLSLDFASSLDFGLNKISNKNEVYYARAQAFDDADAQDTPCTGDRQSWDERRLDIERQTRRAIKSNNTNTK